MKSLLYSSMNMARIVYEPPYNKHLKWKLNNKEVVEILRKERLRAKINLNNDFDFSFYSSGDKCRAWALVLAHKDNLYFCEYTDLMFKTVRKWVHIDSIEGFL